MEQAMTARLLTLLLLCFPAFAFAQGEDADFIEITPESRAAVERGLAYLATMQAPNGSYGQDRYGDHVGITALAGIAYLADGNVPGRGGYGDNVERCLNFLLDSASESGLMAADTSHGPMYGHGFATLFLGEAYGMAGDSMSAAQQQRLRETLLKAVRLIIDSQNHEGGWRYQPVPYDADISVTICQIMALRSARNAGLSVPKETIDKAVAYVRNCQNPGDGGFRYMLNPGASAFPRSAAGVASLYYAGIYDDEALDHGLDYLHLHGNDMRYRESGHYFYGHYYAAQAMFLAGGEHWQRWFPEVRTTLLTNQSPDGSWTSAHGSHYGTAMACIVLQIPNRLLPIFQR